MRFMFLRSVGICLALAPGHLIAGEVAVDVLPEAKAPEISWSALPLDGLDVQPVVAPDPIRGPWQADLAPGTWLISGLSTDGRSFEDVVTLDEAPSHTLTIPEIEPPIDATYACSDSPTCAFTDEATGLSFTLPEHWGAESPFIPDLPDGAQPSGPSGGFFEITPEGGAYWALNPLDWVAGETGPCEEVAVGLICTFEESPVAKAALAVIAPSLKWQKP